VPDEFLSIAIGKSGQNVRLAARLTGWHLDVKSEAAYSQAMKNGYDSLMELPGIGLETAEKLYSGGYSSPEELLEITPEELSQLTKMSVEDAENIIKAVENELEKASREESEDIETASKDEDDQVPGDENTPDKTDDFEEEK